MNQFSGYVPQQQFDIKPLRQDQVFEMQEQLKVDPSQGDISLIGMGSETQMSVATRPWQTYQNIAYPGGALNKKSVCGSPIFLSHPKGLQKAFEQQEKCNYLFPTVSWYPTPQGLYSQRT